MKNKYNRKKKSHLVLALQIYGHERTKIIGWLTTQLVSGTALRSVWQGSEIGLGELRSVWQGSAFIRFRGIKNHVCVRTMKTSIWTI